MSFLLLNSFASIVIVVSLWSFLGWLVKENLNVCIHIN